MVICRGGAQTTEATEATTVHDFPELGARMRFIMVFYCRTLFAQLTCQGDQVKCSQQVTVVAGTTLRGGGVLTDT